MCAQADRYMSYSDGMLSGTDNVKAVQAVVPADQKLQSVDTFDNQHTLYL